MKYVLVGLAFGLIWAALQWSSGAITAPAALAGPVLLCTAFGGLLWGARVLVLRVRARRRGPSR